MNVRPQKGSKAKTKRPTTNLVRIQGRIVKRDKKEGKAEQALKIRPTRTRRVEGD